TFDCPLTVSGLSTIARTLGACTITFWLSEPNTHQLSSSPSLRTNTIVVGPSLLGLTSTSPDRESATRNSPSTGSVKPTNSTANPRAASTGSVYRVVES